MASKGTLAPKAADIGPLRWRLVSGILILNSAVLGLVAIILWVLKMQGGSVPAGLPPASLFSGIMYLLLAGLAFARLLRFSKVPSVTCLLIAGFAFLLLLDQIWAVGMPGSELRLALQQSFGVSETMLPPLLGSFAILALSLGFGFTHPDGRDRNVGTLFMSYAALLVPIAVTYGYLLSDQKGSLFGSSSGISIWSAITLTSLALAQIMIAANHSIKRFKKIVLANPFALS